jgi:hypothetical protein
MVQHITIIDERCLRTEHIGSMTENGNLRKVIQNFVEKHEGLAWET